MKAVHVIGILVFLLVTVSSASAATFYLTNTSENVTGIKIAVTFNGTHITVEDASPALTGISNVDIKAIGLCVDNSSIKSVTDASGANSKWTNKVATSNSISKFGTFSTLCSSTDSKKTRGPIVIELKQAVTQLPKNELNNSIVVHLGFGTYLLDVSTNEMEDSSWVGGGSTQIPEFPSIALPVAAVLGLMFVLGNKRKE
ncbi:MAG: PEF-CTERM sorting domain-containing protein [Methanosarcina sp.]